MITVHNSGATIEELREIEPVTPKEAGRRWKAVQHGELADTIKDEVITRGWLIESELYSVAHDGADMAGALLLSRVGGVEEVPGVTLALGFLNSNARRKALQLTVGASVTCCTNGMCTGNILLNRVHDHTVDLVEEIEDAVDRYAMAAVGIPDVVRGLRETELMPYQANYILMKVGHQKLIGWTAIGRVDKEYRNPTFAEHGKYTSWALLNAFTYIARGHINPMKQMEAYATFRSLLPGAVELN